MSRDLMESFNKPEMFRLRFVTPVGNVTTKRLKIEDAEAILGHLRDAFKQREVTGSLTVEIENSDEVYILPFDLLRQSMINVVPVRV